MLQDTYAILKREMNQNLFYEHHLTPTAAPCPRLRATQIMRKVTNGIHDAEASMLWQPFTSCCRERTHPASSTALSILLCLTGPAPIHLATTIPRAAAAAAAALGKQRFLHTCFPRRLCCAPTRPHASLSSGLCCSTQRCRVADRAVGVRPKTFSFKTAPA